MSEFYIREVKVYRLIPFSEIEATLSEKERLLVIIINRLVVELREKQFIEGFENESWDETLLCFYDKWSASDIKRHAENLRAHSLLSPFDVEEVIEDYEDFVFFDERLKPYNQLGLMTLCAYRDNESDHVATFMSGVSLAKRLEKQKRVISAKKGHAKNPVNETRKAIQEEWERDSELYGGNKSAFVRERRQKWEDLNYILPLTDKTIKEDWLPKK